MSVHFARAKQRPGRGYAVVRGGAWVGVWLVPLLLAVAPAEASSSGFVSVEEGGFVRLSNGENLRAAVAPAHGGELTSLEYRDACVWRELLFRAADYETRDGWRGKAPFLWPAVGPSLDPGGAGRGFRVDDRYYPMPMHGFARDRSWRVVASGRAADHAFAELALSSDAETRTRYPFDFELAVEYRLDADRLALTYTVEAAAHNPLPMPFGIGNHITFRAPLIAGHDAADLRFRTDLPLQLLRDDDRTFSGRTQPSTFTGEVPLDALPRRSAVSLGGRPGPAELTVIDPSGLQVSLRHVASREPTAPAIRFNLWADTVEGFFSPEPWLGTQNGLNTGTGLIRLDPGERWNWRIEIAPSASKDPVTHCIEESI